jgi:cell division protein ZipA
MDLLRWALLGVGVLVILSVYFWERRRHRRVVEARQRREAADDEGFAAELEKLSGLVAQARRDDWRDEQGDAAEEEGGEAGRREPRLEASEQSVSSQAPAMTAEAPEPAQSPEASAPSEPSTSRETPPGEGSAREETSTSQTRRRADADELILTLTVLARGGRLIPGQELLAAFGDLGMAHGDMGIFHRMAQGPQGEQPLYSAANVLKPGSFDVEHMSETLTPGLALFMHLPGPGEAASTFKQFVAAAERLASRFDAAVCDAQRRPVDQRMFRAMWDRVLDFEARENERRRQSRKQGG